MEFYWELIKKDGTRYEIPPSAVELIRRKMKNHDSISLKTAEIPYSEIKDFQITSKRFNAQHLLDDAARVFNEPVLNPDGSVASAWVKFPVTQSRWAKFYQPSGYAKTAEEGGMVTVAIFQPLHQIDLQVVEYCTADEASKLEHKRNTKQ